MARAGDKFLHQPYVVVAEAAGDNVGFRDFMRGGDVERDVNASLFEVARDVLPEIRELQRGAGCVGELLALRVAVAAEVEGKVADRIRGVNAIVEDGVPIGIALDGLILAKSFEEIGERLFRDVFGDDRFAEGDKNCVGGMAFVAGIEFALPPIEEFEGAIWVGDFVAEIVGPAAVGVDVVEMLVEFFGEKPGHYVEIFIVVGG